MRYPENYGKFSNLNENKESISEINKNIIMGNENINSNIQIENNSNSFLINNNVNNPSSDLKKNNNNGNVNVNRKDDVSIVEITNSARVITDADIKNAPSLIIEVDLT